MKRGRIINQMMRPFYFTGNKSISGSFLMIIWEQQSFSVKNERKGVLSSGFFP